MKYSVLHEEPYTRKYKASSCSAAFICKAVTTFIAIVLPLLIVFATQGMWKKYGQYSEQPDVHFKNRYVIMLKGASFDDYLLWSTYPVLNQAEYSHIRIPIVETTTVDRNDDGKADMISIAISFPLSDKEEIFGAFWMLLFDYRLDLRSRFSMETALIGDLERLKAARSLSITGDFTLEQSTAFASFGSDANHGGPLMNESMLDVSYYVPAEVMLRNSLRNFTTVLKSTILNYYFDKEQLLRKRYNENIKDMFSGHLITHNLEYVPERNVEVWSSKSSKRDTFTLNFTVRIAEQMLIYKSGLFELLKFAWMQYLSVFLVVHFLLKKLLEFIFENYIVSTVIIEDKHLQ